MNIEKAVQAAIILESNRSETVRTVIAKAVLVALDTAGYVIVSKESIAESIDTRSGDDPPPI